MVSHLFFYQLALIALGMYDLAALLAPGRHPRPTWQPRRRARDSLRGVWRVDARLPTA
jgi:hypothetical protein